MALLQNPFQHSSVGLTASNFGLSITDGVSDEFPTGLRVLVVDDDKTCLTVLDLMLRRCLYQVTTCSQALVALNLLRERKGCFDMVLSDVHMSDMDGFTLLDHVGMEIHLPVIMMSADMSTSAVMKGIKHGACDYLIKPVRQEELKNMWQHVVRKKWNESREHDVSSILGDVIKNGGEDDVENASEECRINNIIKRRKNPKEDDVDLESDDPSTSRRKPRVVWSEELHVQFVAAVHQLGIDKAVPKKILDLMNVPGLTRENVASHLQKFRLYLRKVNAGRIRHPFGRQAEPSLDMPFPMGILNTQSFLQMLDSDLAAMDQQSLLHPPFLRAEVPPSIPPYIRPWPSNAGSTPSSFGRLNVRDDTLIALLQQHPQQVSTTTGVSSSTLLPCHYHHSDRDAPSQFFCL